LFEGQHELREAIKRVLDDAAVDKVRFVLLIFPSVSQFEPIDC
jgi:hypothetical protein